MDNGPAAGPGPSSTDQLSAPDTDTCAYRTAIRGSGDNRSFMLRADYIRPMLAARGDGAKRLIGFQRGPIIPIADSTIESALRPYIPHEELPPGFAMQPGRAYTVPRKPHLPNSRRPVSLAEGSPAHSALVTILAKTGLPKATVPAVSLLTVTDRKSVEMPRSPQNLLREVAPNNSQPRIVPPQTLQPGRSKSSCLENALRAKALMNPEYWLASRAHGPFRAEPEPQPVGQSAARPQSGTNSRVPSDLRKQLVAPAIQTKPAPRLRIDVGTQAPPETIEFIAQEIARAAVANRPQLLAQAWKAHIDVQSFSLEEPHRRNAQNYDLPNTGIRVATQRVRTSPDGNATISIVE